MKKTIAVLLSFILLLSLCAGCAAAETNNPEDTSSSTVSTNDSNVDVSETNGYEDASAYAASIDNANIEGHELSYIEVACKVHSSGSYIIGTPTTFGSIYIPFKADWAIGSKYIYTLSFGSGAGGFDQNGNPTLAIISYDIDSMEDWQTVERSAMPISDSYNITSSDEIL